MDYTVHIGRRLGDWSISVFVDSVSGITALGTAVIRQIAWGILIGAAIGYGIKWLVYLASDLATRSDRTKK